MFFKWPNHYFIDLKASFPERLSIKAAWKLTLKFQHTLSKALEEEAFNTNLPTNFQCLYPLVPTSSEVTWLGLEFFMVPHTLREDEASLPILGNSNPSKQAYFSCLSTDVRFWDAHFFFFFFVFIESREPG